MSDTTVPDTVAESSRVSLLKVTFVISTVTKAGTSEAACKDAQFYYKNVAGALEWVYSACEFDVAGATCNPSATLIKSYDVK